MPEGTYLLSLLNYGEQPVCGLEIRSTTGNDAPDVVTAFSATGATTALPVLVLGGGLLCVRPPALDVELFLPGIQT